MNSPLYTGSDTDATLSYYQAIEISAPTTGIYSILCDSIIDTYGYIYNRTFNPGDPDQNLLSSDDDSGGNKQFLVLNALEAMAKYILIVTTYDEMATGSFTVIGQGPDLISFSPSKQYNTKRIFCRTNGNQFCDIKHFWMIVIEIYSIVCTSQVIVSSSEPAGTFPVFLRFRQSYWSIWVAFKRCH